MTNHPNRSKIADIKYMFVGYGTEGTDYYGHGYHVIIYPRKNKPTEFPFGEKLWRTKKSAREAVAAAYFLPDWRYNPAKNTIYIG